MPALVKSPPAYTLPLPSTASALTVLFMPLPSALHVLPFHLAIRLQPAALSHVPALVKEPPAYTLPLPSTASASTVLFMPLPSALHVLPSHLAT